MEKIVYILRGIPGCGKSTLADELTNTTKSSLICCADDYFINIETGEYIWNEERLGSAHMWCESIFRESLEDETEIVVVSNTNIHQKNVNIYRDLALKYNYKVFVLTVENWHYGKDIHNVPKDQIDKNKKLLRSSIEL